MIHADISTNGQLNWCYANVSVVTIFPLFLWLIKFDYKSKPKNQIRILILFFIFPCPRLFGGCNSFTTLIWPRLFQLLSEKCFKIARHFFLHLILVKTILEDVMFSPLWKCIKIARQVFHHLILVSYHWGGHQVRVRCRSQELVFGRDPLWWSDQGPD